MDYFITGGSGFIGRRLIKKVLQRPNSRVHFLMRAAHLDRVPDLLAYWGVEADRAIPVVGDMTHPLLGVGSAELEPLIGKVDHFLHLAAIYDLNAKAGIQQQVNTEGTR